MSASNYDSHRESKAVSTTYELPKLVKSVQGGWQLAFTSSATVTALFAAVESQLLTFVKGLTAGEQPVDLESKGYRALLILTYASLFLSVSATVSSLILNDEFGELDHRAAYMKGVEPASSQEAIRHESVEHILESHGLSQSSRWVKRHWMATLLLGYLCFVAQLFVYVSLGEPLDVRIAVYCIGTFCLLPLLALCPGIVNIGK